MIEGNTSGQQVVVDPHEMRHVGVEHDAEPALAQPERLLLLQYLLRLAPLLRPLLREDFLLGLFALERCEHRGLGLYRVLSNQICSHEKRLKWFIYSSLI